MRQNYRRETKDLMKQIKTSMNQFCLEFGISPATYRNWVNGLAGPQTSEKFERLKQIASGETQLPPGQPPPAMDRIWGHIDQLTKQIAQLQGQVAVLQDHHERRMLESEKKISELVEAVRVQAEQFADRVSRQKKTG